MMPNVLGGRLGPRSLPIYEALRARIERGELPPGAQLPPHGQLAREFNVAPMTVRQVLTQLELEGRVIKHVGRGTFVRDPRPTASTPAAEDLVALCAMFTTALRLGHRDRALDLLTTAASTGVALDALYVDVVQPALYSIGDMWQGGQLSVAAEHLATAISDTAMSTVVSRIPPRPSNGRQVVVACVQGELHDLGPRMVADLLRIDGFDVSFLGADVPTTALGEMVRARRPDLVVLSATLADRAEPLVEATREVRGAAESVLIAVGGQILSRVPGLDEALDADIVAAGDARQTVGAVRHKVLDERAP